MSSETASDDSPSLASARPNGRPRLGLAIRRWGWRSGTGVGDQALGLAISRCQRLPPFLKPIGQEGIQLGHRVDLGHRLLDGILHAAKFELRVVQDYVTRPRVAVTRLTHAADVDHHFVARQRIARGNLVGAEEAAVLRENARDMRVPLKGIAVDQRKNPLQLAEIVYVLGKDIFAERIAHRTV